MDITKNNQKEIGIGLIILSLFSLLFTVVTNTVQDYYFFRVFEVFGLIIFFAIIYNIIKINTK